MPMLPGNSDSDAPSFMAQVSELREFCDVLRKSDTVEPLLYDHPQNHIGVVV